MFIDNSRLKLLLEQKRNSIGISGLYRDILTFVISMISLGLAFYSTPITFGIVYIAIIVLSTSAVLLTILSFIKDYKNRYSHNELYKDISALDKLAHPFNIIVIQNKAKNKVLTTYDKRWNMWLFLYKKASSNNQGASFYNKELSFIKEHLASLFNISIDSISGSYALQEFTEKYSVSDKCDKTYDHRFYKISIDNLPEDNDTFEIDGTKYKWWNINDLEIDAKTVENNSEIVAKIKNEVL